MLKILSNIFIGVFLATGISLSPADELVPASDFFDESFGDLAEEVKIAEEDGKQALLIMFEMDECPYCHWMKQKVLNKKSVQDFYRENFRIISIDTEGDIELTDLSGNETTQKDFSLKQFRVRATPVFQFIGLDGLPIRGGRLTGKTKDDSEFLLFAKFVMNGDSKKTSFSRYKRRLRKRGE